MGDFFLAGFERPDKRFLDLRPKLGQLGSFNRVDIAPHGGLEGSGRFADVEAESAWPDPAACLDESLVKAMTVSPRDRYSGMGDDGQLLRAGRPGRHSGEDPPRGGRPEFGAEETHCMCCERVPEVDENDSVLFLRCDGMVERDRPAIAFQRMVEVGHRPRPGTRQFRHSEQPVLASQRFERTLIGERQSSGDDPLDRFWRDVELDARVFQACPEASHLLANVALDAGQCSFARAAIAYCRIIERPPLSQHRFLKLLCEHVTGRAEVLPYCLNFAGDKAKDVEVEFEASRRRLFESSGYEMVDLNFWRGLAVPVDAAVSLFQTHGRPWDS